MEESMQLRIGGLVLIFGLSVISFASPVLYVNHLRSQMTIDGKHEKLGDAISMDMFKAMQESDNYRILKCASSGVILGVAMLHLLNDSIADFSEISEYPFALLITIIGMVFGLATDNIANYMIDNYKEPCKLARKTRDTPINGMELAVQNENHDDNHQHDHQHDHCHHICLHDSIDNNVVISAVRSKDENAQNECAVHSPVAIKQKAVVKAIMMEAAIAIHTVIIGFGFGAIDDVEEVKIIMAALAFHQFFEGVSLGLACFDASLSRYVTACLCLLFSLSWVAGVLLGMFTVQGDDGVVVQAVFNALAAGLLMHTAIIEMMAEDFNLVGASDSKNGTKLWMLLALVLGIASMAILAIYA